MHARWCSVLVLALVSLAAHAVPFWGAKESRPPETPTEELQPGEFVWNPGVAPAGPIVVLVSLGEQRAYVYRNGARSASAPSAAASRVTERRRVCS